METPIKKYEVVEHLENSMIVGCYYYVPEGVHWEIQEQTYGGMEVLHWGECWRTDVENEIRTAMEKYIQ